MQVQNKESSRAKPVNDGIEPALRCHGQVYANTGGQVSAATPRGAQAKFAEAGVRTRKADLATAMVARGDVYVASVCFAANPTQAMRALVEAEAYPGRPGSRAPHALGSPFF